MNRDSLIAIALETLSELGETRQAWVNTVIGLSGREKGLALADAMARQKATQAAGGPKALGSNAELREQALTIALANDTDYGFAQGMYEDAFEQEARTKQGMYTLKDTLKLFEILLETSSEV